MASADHRGPPRNLVSLTVLDLLARPWSVPVPPRPGSVIRGSSSGVIGARQP